MGDIHGVGDLSLKIGNVTARRRVRACLGKEASMRITTIALCAAALLASAASPALSQDKSFKESIIGAWIVTGVADVGENGQARDSWKGQTTGQITLGRTGRFSQILVGPAVASMKSDEPRKPDRLVVAHYGTYTVDEAAKKINFKIEGSAYSPRVKTDGSWMVEGKGDKLTFNGSPRKDGMGPFTPKLQVQRP
jgi:hypothetical protein